MRDTHINGVNQTMFLVQTLNWSAPERDVQGTLAIDFLRRPQNFAKSPPHFCLYVQLNLYQTELLSRYVFHNLT